MIADKVHYFNNHIKTQSRQSRKWSGSCVLISLIIHWDFIALVWWVFFPLKLTRRQLAHYELFWFHKIFEIQTEFPLCQYEMSFSFTKIFKPSFVKRKGFIWVSLTFICVNFIVCTVSASLHLWNISVNDWNQTLLTQDSRVCNV